MVGKILIVDDVAANRIVMKVKLTAAGYLPVLAHDGAACLSMARAERPDLVILDLMLPGRSGLEIVESLRADPATHGLPVLMLTAKGAGREREAAERAGVSRFMTKPFSNADILASVRALAGR